MAYKLVRLSSLSAKPVDYTLFDSDILYSTIGTPDWVASGYSNTVSLTSSRLTLGDIANYLATNATAMPWASAGDYIYPATNSNTVTARRVDVTNLYSTGNVGIGTTAPGTLLELEGSGSSLLTLNSTSSYTAIEFEENGNARFRILTNDGSSGIRFYDTGASAERMRIDSTGNVGIGTDAPVHRLDMGGADIGNVEDIHFNGGSDSTSYLRSPNEENWTVSLVDSTDSNNITWQVADGGNMGIGGAASTNQLTVYGSMHVNSNITAGADVVAYYSSDVKLKDNISNISFPLEKIEQLNGVQFAWNSLAEDKTGEEYGVIAQEVEQVLPLAVAERDNGFKAVRYEKLIPLLIESIKELSEKVKQLEGNR